MSLEVNRFCDLAIFCSSLVLTVIFGWWLRKKHHESLHYVFYVISAAIFFEGLTRITFATLNYDPQSIIYTGCHITLTVLVIITTSILIPLTPKIMRLPGTTELYNNLVDLHIQMEDLRFRVNLASEAEIKKASELVKQTIEDIKKPLEELKGDKSAPSETESKEL